jgi:hypothetical protein
MKKRNKAPSFKKNVSSTQFDSKSCCTKEEELPKEAVEQKELKDNLEVLVMNCPQSEEE